MNTGLRIFLTLIFFQILLSGEIQAQYTIDICQKKAAENYPLIRQYGLIESSKMYDLKNAGMAYLPQVAFQAKASYQSDVTEIPLNIPGINIESLSKDQYNTAVQVDQLVWDGGITSLRKSAIRQQSELERSKVDVDMYAIKERVSQTYFGIVLIDKQIEQLNLLLKDLDRNLNRIRSYMDNGLANQSDIDLINVEIINAGQKMCELNAGRKAYISVLSSMMGVEPDFKATFEVPQHLTVSKEIKRPELSVMANQSKLLDIQAGMVRSQLRPRFGLYFQAGYGRPGLNMLENQFSPFYIAGVKAVWSLGGLYTRKNELNMIDINKKRIENTRDAFIYNTNLQVIIQSEEIDKIAELLRRDDEIIFLREKILTAAEIKQSEGVISVSELMHEMNQLDGARVTRARHEVELLMAKYNLKITTNN